MAAGTGTERRGSCVPLPPAGFLAALAAIAAVAALPLEAWPPQPWNLAGLALLAAGLALALLADAQFRRAGTAVKPFHTPSALVTGGAFKLSRNPMYLGLTLALAGAAVALQSPLGLLAGPVFAAWVEACFIRSEERRLDETFGAAYRDYSRRVRRWV